MSLPLATDGSPRCDFAWTFRIASGLVPGETLPKCPGTWPTKPFGILVLRGRRCYLCEVHGPLMTRMGFVVPIEGSVD
jgi:hypothetical protein